MPIPRLFLSALLAASAAARAGEDAAETDEALGRRVAAIAADLGNDAWQKREDASRSLAALGPRAVPHLAPYVRSEDPEVRERVRLVLAGCMRNAGSSPEELQLAARAGRLLAETGALSAEAAAFMAWQLACGADPAQRDQTKAVELAEHAVKERPENLVYPILLAIVKKDAAHAAELVAAVDTGTANNIAWGLVINPAATSRNPEVALMLAKKAVADMPDNAALLDTLAAAQASVGNFAEAVRQQENALKVLNGAIPITRMDDFARRHAVYIALSRAQKGEYEGFIFGSLRFKGARIRDALLAARQAAENDSLRASFENLLRNSYPDDPEVKKALPPKPEGGAPRSKSG